MPPATTGGAIFLVYLHDKMEAALPHQLYYIPAQRNVRGYPIPRGYTNALHFSILIKEG